MTLNDCSFKDNRTKLERKNGIYAKLRSKDKK